MNVAEQFKAVGRAEAMVETLLRQLRQRFGRLSLTRSNRIRRASLQELRRWSDLVITAPSLTAMFSRRRAVRSQRPGSTARN